MTKKAVNEYLLNYGCWDFVLLDTNNRNYSGLKISDMVKPAYAVNDDGTVRLNFFLPGYKSVTAVINKKPYALEKDGDYFIADLDLPAGVATVTLVSDNKEVLYPYLPIGIYHNRPSNYIEIIEEGSVYEDKSIHCGSVVTSFLYNSVTNRKDRIQIYLPYGYEKSGYSYDVLFLQHGFGENDLAWLTEGKLNVLLDNLIEEKTIKPLIVVMANGMLRKVENDTIVMIHPYYKDYLLNDIIPFIKNNYRINDGYYLAGLSMGSVQASVAAFTYPELFKCVGLFSGFMSDVITGYVDHLAEDNIRKFIDSGCLLFRGIGDQDRFMPFFTKENQLCEQYGIKDRRVICHGEHEWNVWRQLIIDFLKMREEYE